MSPPKKPTYQFPKPIVMSRGEMLEVLDGKYCKVIKSGDLFFLQDTASLKVYVFDHACACANLPEPEKNIRELACAAGLVAGEVDTDEEGLRLPPSRQSVDRPEKALAPFEEKK